MERKEFNSVEEAIEALNEIDNIDYTNIPRQAELAERAFYNRLMNNLMGTRNLKFTDEQRRNYQEALKRKGLLTYSEWKKRQPRSNEKVTWKDSVERGSLDAPVNIFSKLIEADDAEKFQYIQDAVDERKSDIGKNWVNNNSKKIATLRSDLMNTIAKRKPRQQMTKPIKKFNINDYIGDDKKVERVLKRTNQGIGEFVARELEQRQEGRGTTAQNSQILDDTVPMSPEEIKRANNRTIHKKEEYNDLFESKHRIFKSHDDVIAALKSIDKVDLYASNSGAKAPDKFTQQKFYYDVMKTLIDSSDLPIPGGKDGEKIAYDYRQALKEIGCIREGELKSVKLLNRHTRVPAKIIDQILSSNPRDNNIDFKNACYKIRDDEKLNEWLDKTEISIYDHQEKEQLKQEKEEQKREKQMKRMEEIDRLHKERLEIEQQKEEQQRRKSRYPVPVKKEKNPFKKMGKYAASVLGLLGFGAAIAASTNAFAHDALANPVDKKNPKPLKIDDDKEKDTKNKEKEDKKLEENLKEAGVDAQSFEEELQNSLNYTGYNYQRGGGQGYTATPDSHEEKNTEANKKINVKIQESKTLDEIVEKAKQEIAEKELEVVYEEETVESEDVGISSDGTVGIGFADDASDSSGDDREVIDMEISWGDEGEWVGTEIQSPTTLPGYEARSEEETLNLKNAEDLNEDQEFENEEEEEKSKEDDGYTR